MMNSENLLRLALSSLLFAIAIAAPARTDAQSSGRSTRGSEKTPTAADYSRASQSIISGSGPQQASPQNGTQDEKLDRVIKQLELVVRRLDALVAPAAVSEGRESKDDSNKALLASLDIIMKGEQRVDSLRKQLFEVIERESAVKARLDQLDLDLRPEAIERSLAFTGSLRPEEAREARRKSLEAERKNVQAGLTEMQSVRTGLETNLRKAEALVEKLRQRFEKDIEKDLGEQ